MNMRRWLASQDPGFYVALALIGLSAGVAWGARELGLGEMRSPGPGFVYFWTAIFLGALALRMLVRVMRRPERGGTPLWKGLHWGRVVGVTAALLAYAYLLERIGYLVATGLFSAVLFALLAESRRRWWLIVAGALVTTGVTYVVFDHLFSVQLPRGVLGL
jgi:putative tricarboxylic transport membrane protein